MVNYGGKKSFVRIEWTFILPRELGPASIFREFGATCCCVYFVTAFNFSVLYEIPAGGLVRPEPPSFSSAVCNQQSTAEMC